MCFQQSLRAIVLSIIHSSVFYLFFFLIEPLHIMVASVQPVFLNKGNLFFQFIRQILIIIIQKSYIFSMTLLQSIVSRCSSAGFSGRFYAEEIFPSQIWLQNTAEASSRTGSGLTEGDPATVEGLSWTAAGTFFAAVTAGVSVTVG